MAYFTRLHPVAAVPLVVVAALLLSNCGLGGSSTGSVDSGLQVTQPRSLGVGQSVVLTVKSGTGAPFTPNWAIYGPATNSVGTLSAQTGNSITYTAPPTPPIYTVVSFAIPQGQVQVQVEDTTGGLRPTDAQIVITAPSVTVSISPQSLRLIHGGIVYFDGYAVGAVNGAVTWQVNGVTGGSTTYGTVTQSGAYTAPSVVPVGGSATVTVVSVTDPTKSASAAVTIF